MSVRMMGNTYAKGHIKSEEECRHHSELMKMNCAPGGKDHAHMVEMSRKAPSKRGQKMPPERLERFRAEMARRGRYPEGWGKFPRGPHTEEHKRKIRLSVIARGAKHPLTQERLKRLWADPEYRERMRQQNLGNSYSLGTHHIKSPETRMKMSLYATRSWTIPELAHKKLVGQCHPTWPEVRVADVLWQDHLLPGRFEYNGRVDAGVTVDGCIPDFVWRERKLVIEVHGGYYHLHFKRWSERRATKLKLYQDAGYRILELWDDELYDDFDPDIVSAKIHGLINWGR